MGCTFFILIMLNVDLPLLYRVVNHAIVVWQVKVPSAMKIQACVGVNLVWPVGLAIDANPDTGITRKKDAFVIRLLKLNIELNIDHYE